MSKYDKSPEQEAAEKELYKQLANECRVRIRHYHELIEKEEDRIVLFEEGHEALFKRQRARASQE